MSARANPVRVGAFVLGAIALLIAGLIASAVARCSRKAPASFPTSVVRHGLEVGLLFV
jgi:hypothetical protein